MTGQPLYEGVSWVELHASYQYEKVWVEFAPTNGDEPVLMKITRLSDFRGGSSFFVDGKTQQGDVIELLGRSSRSNEPATFVSAK